MRAGSAASLSDGGEDLRQDERGGEAGDRHGTGKRTDKDSGTGGKEENKGTICNGFGGNPAVSGDCAKKMPISQKLQTLFLNFSSGYRVYARFKA